MLHERPIGRMFFNGLQLKVLLLSHLCSETNSSFI